MNKQEKTEWVNTNSRAYRRAMKRKEAKAAAKAKQHDPRAVKF